MVEKIDYKDIESLIFQKVTMKLKQSKKSILKHFDMKIDKRIHFFMI